jgi:hypothetical protein
MFILSLSVYSDQQELGESWATGIVNVKFVILLGHLGIKHVRWLRQLDSQVNYKTQEI